MLNHWFPSNYEAAASDSSGMGSGSPRSRSRAAQDADVAGPEVLIVDDDRVIVTALRSLIRRRGAAVRVAYSVSEALASLESDGSPDWMLLDLMLPDGEGERVLRAVRQRGLETQVVVSTGVSDPARLRELEQLGADAVMRKPVAISELFGMMGLG